MLVKEVRQQVLLLVREAVEQRSWTTTRERHGKLGGVVLSVPEGSSGPSTVKNSLKTAVSFFDHHV